MSVPTLSYEQLQARYQLLCKTCQPDSSLSKKLNLKLNELELLIQKELIDLMRERCPNTAFDIIHAFEQELDRFKLFCEYPHLAHKAVVGVGGGFSAGKSSLINQLIGKKRLVVEIDPTTSMPAYVLKGDKERISAINHYQHQIDLSQEEFDSLTHEEVSLYGSQVGRMLKAAFIMEPDFQWDHLAILDTPGYSKSDNDWDNLSDENIAKHQLNTANYIIWVISAESGVISEQDIQFLGHLDKDIPKLVVISRADKREDSDVEKIVALTKETLKNRGVIVLDVIAYSIRKSSTYSIKPIIGVLSQWDKSKLELTFAKNFKKQFLNYITELDQETLDIQSLIQGIGENNTLTDKLTIIEQLKTKLNKLSEQFFTQLKSIGDMVGVPLPEPSTIETMTLLPVNISESLTQFMLLNDENIKRSTVWVNFNYQRPSTTKIKSLLFGKRFSQKKELTTLSTNERYQYVILHAAFLLNNGSLNREQETLYQIWLKSLFDDVSLSTILSKAQNISLQQLIDMTELLRKKKIVGIWLFELINFIRLAENITLDFKRLLTNWCANFELVTDKEIHFILAISDLTFRINTKFPIIHSDVVASIICNNFWVMCYAKRPSRWGNIDPGVWFIDDNYYHFDELIKEKMKNSILIFEKRTKEYVGSHYDYPTIKDVIMVNPMIDFECRPSFNNVFFINPQIGFMNNGITMNECSAVTFNIQEKNIINISLPYDFDIKNCYFKSINVQSQIDLSDGVERENKIKFTLFGYEIFSKENKLYTFTDTRHVNLSSKNG